MNNQLPEIVFCTPDEWGAQTFCATFDELCAIAAEIDADPHRGPVQYQLIGAPDRSLARGWYQHFTYEIADGRVMWGLHCVELDANLKPLRQGYCQQRQVHSDVDKAEREMLMRCLADAQPC